MKRNALPWPQSRPLDLKLNPLTSEVVLKCTTYYASMSPSKESLPVISDTDLTDTPAGLGTLLVYIQCRM